MPVLTNQFEHGQFFKDFLTQANKFKLCRKIAAYIKTDGGYSSMADGSSVPISRQKREEVLKRILDK